ncbi:MAG TPA: hypothetical protein VGM28_10870 [Candidatus Limnocylindrales bacterium]|jgi:hypothetical protein
MVASGLGDWTGADASAADEVDVGEDADAGDETNGTEGTVVEAGDPEAGASGAAEHAATARTVASATDDASQDRRMREIVHHGGKSRTLRDPA